MCVCGAVKNKVECLRLPGCTVLLAKCEREHVLAQLNVWEIESEKQMAALVME